MRVLMVTSEWPDSDNPHWAPFIVRQVEFLRKAGVDVDLLPFRGAKNPINYLRTWLEVRRKLRQFSYDLVHAQWAQSALTVLPTRLPLVVTFRGGEVKGIVGSSGNYTALGYILRAVSGFVAWRADELIVVSSEMRKYLPRRHSHVVPSGLDFSMFSIVSQDEARRKLGLPLSKRLVLFVGNPASPLKRYALAKEIVDRLDRALEAELVVVWRTPHKLVPVYMNACDALLCTSIYEGSPNVIKEALACNLPVVSVNVGDVQARLRGVSGCSVCPDDHPASMAVELESVLRQNCRTSGRSVVLDLDEHLLTKQLIGIYSQAVRKRAQS